MLFLEALTYEALFSFLFYSRLLATLGQTRVCRIGIGLVGFNEAHLDWTGFSETGEGQRAPLVNWRFKPQVDRATFERGGIPFPITNENQGGFEQQLAKVIQDLAFEVVGTRFSPLQPQQEAQRLELSEASVQAVIRSARIRAQTAGALG